MARTNIKDWKPKDPSINLKDAQANVMIHSIAFDGYTDTFLAKSHSERRKIIKEFHLKVKGEVYDLLNEYKPKPHIPYPTYKQHYKDSCVVNIKATFGELKKLAKHKIIHDIFISDAKDAINIERIKFKEWEKDNCLFVFGIELKTKEKKPSKYDLLFMVNASGIEIARKKAQEYFNNLYAKEFTGEITLCFRTSLEMIHLLEKRNKVVEVSTDGVPKACFKDIYSSSFYSF